jgi:hypothetical protein
MLPVLSSAPLAPMPWSAGSRTTPENLLLALTAILVPADVMILAVAEAPERALVATLATPARNAARSGGWAAALTDSADFPDSEVRAETPPTVFRTAVARASSSTTVPGMAARDAIDIAARANMATRPTIDPRIVGLTVAAAARAVRAAIGAAPVA